MVFLDPSTIQRVILPCVMIRGGEKLLRNLKKDDEALEIVHVDHWFYLLVPYKKILLVKLLINFERKSDESGKRRC